MHDIDRDATILPLLRHLANRGFASAWANDHAPVSKLAAECSEIVNDVEWNSTLGAYLRSRPIIRLSAETLLAQMAFTAGSRWQDTAPVLHPLSRRGWHISRWLPTFLLVDGPLARFVRDPESPLHMVLRAEPRRFPFLESARDTFNHDLFRRIRNGFGHWSFVWNDDNAGSSITVYHWETGDEIAKLTLLEAEALHIFTFSVIDVFTHEIFERVNV